MKSLRPVRINERALLKQQIESGTDAEAKAWAREAPPTVTEHLKRARELATGATGGGAGR